MPQINIAPTRTNLIRLKKELRFAKEGYEILDRKREALTGELVRVAKEADALQKEVWALLETAYGAMDKARVVMGSDHVEWAALAVNKTVDVHMRMRGIMGVAIPQIEFIVSSLEEREREETFRLKWLKTKMTKQTSSPG